MVIIDEFLIDPCVGFLMSFDPLYNFKTFKPFIAQFTFSNYVAAERD